jgi:hypothetical protein
MRQPSAALIFSLATSNSLPRMKARSSDGGEKAMVCQPSPLAFGECGRPGRTLRGKKTSISGLGSLGWAILSSARSRFCRFWPVATTMVGDGDRLGVPVL